MNIETREITLEPIDNARLMSLCGPFDDNIKQLERRLGIEINRRDNAFKLVGRALCVHAAVDILRHLYVDTSPVRGNIPDIDLNKFTWLSKKAGCWNRPPKACRNSAKRYISKPNVG